MTATFYVPISYQMKRPSKCFLGWIQGDGHTSNQAFASMKGMASPGPFTMKTSN